MTRLVELAELCEKASGPDRELYAMIYDAVYGGECLYDPKWETWITPGGMNVPAFTASLDAALTLVPEGWDWASGSGQFGGHAFMRRVTSVGEPPAISSDAATPALALCAAALRARATQDGGEG